MNYKNAVILFTVALLLSIIVGSVGAAVPIDNSIKTDGCGELNIQTLSHTAVIGNTLAITRVELAYPFVNGLRVAKEDADNYLPVSYDVKKYLDANGKYNDRIAPGIFKIQLFDGNGGQPEYAIAEVVLSQKTNVVFIGHGVSQYDTRTRCEIEGCYHIPFGEDGFILTSGGIS